MNRTRIQRVSHRKLVRTGGSCAPVIPGVRCLLFMKRVQACHLYLLSILLVLCGGCLEDYPSEERLLIEWHDSTHNITFRVTERPGAIVNTFTRLYVERDSNVNDVQIDDDARFGTISLVRYENWLLVLSDNEVWAGYDYTNSRLLGEHRWEELPFTIRQSKGEVVASRWIHWRSSSPASFPEIPEPGI